MTRTGVTLSTYVYKRVLRVHAGMFQWYVINPGRACAARVTVVVLRVRPSVCPGLLALWATRRLMSDTNSFSAIYKGLKNNVAILLKRLRSRDIVKTGEKANIPSPSICGGQAHNNCAPLN